MGITFTPEEQIAMQDVVSRMMMRLRKDMKRMKNNQNRGKLHVIKTIQKNYRHDMVPFQVALRRKRREKPRLVVLCDVSFSVSHASRFMLLLLHTLHNQMLDVRSFIFNREVAEITEMLANMPVNDLMETIDKGDIVDLDENSSFGQVFLSFKKEVSGEPAGQTGLYHPGRRSQQLRRGQRLGSGRDPREGPLHALAYPGRA